MAFNDDPMLGGQAGAHFTNGEADGLAAPMQPQNTQQYGAPMSPMMHMGGAPLKTEKRPEQM